MTLSTSLPRVLRRLVCNLLALGTNVLAADGDLDTTYNTPTGYNSVSFGASDNVYGGVLQPDGKFIIIGGGRPVSNQEMSAARFNADGTLDTNFATSGKFSLDVNPATSTDRALCGGLQSDGKIIIGGYSRTGSGNDDYAILRLNTNGTLDTTFGTSGIAKVDFNGGSDQANALVVLPDNSIVLVGTAFDFNGSLDVDYSLAKLTANGALDTTFGTGGKVTVDVGDQQDTGKGITLQSDGKIVFCGQSFGTGTTTAVVGRLTAAGVLDTSFGGGDGLYTITNATPYDLRDVKVQSDGKIITVGSGNVSNQLDGLMLRLTSVGDLDTTFNTTGMRTFPYNATLSDLLLSVLIQADGKYIAGGFWQNPTPNLLETVLVRVTAAGALDSGFGTGGSKQIALGSGNNRPAMIGQASDGKILVALEAGASSAENFYAARFLNTAAVSAPTVTSIAPTSGPTAGGTSVTITGTNLSGATGVTIGGVAATSLSANTATSITCVTPAGTAGAKDVVVTTAGGPSTGGTGSFTYVAPPNLSINDVSLTEGDSGTTNYTFTVSLSSPAPAGGVTFDIGTANNTASQPSDYTQSSLTGQTILAGNSGSTFTVQVNGDTLFEANETFFVNVTNVTGATVTDSQGQGTIIDNDAPASIAVSSGNNQSAIVSTNFASPLVALVRNANNNPVQGVSVSFTAPGSGPSATFSTTTNTVTATSNASGLASTGTFAANATAGNNYTVTAAASGGTNPSTSFSLTNVATLPGGNLRLTYNGLGTALSLTETSVGNDTVTVSTPAANTLRIHLNGRGFDPSSSVANVTYEYAGLPAASTYADISIPAASSITTLTIHLGTGTDTLSFGPTLATNVIGISISLAATGTVTLTGSFSAPSVDVLSTSGSIVQSAGTVTATNLALSAPTGIGTGVAGRISTAVGNLEASTVNGGIYIGNTGDLSIGGVAVGLSGVRVATSGAIDILNTSGNVRITTGGDIVKGPGNVIIKTVTSGHIITANNNGFFFSSYDGSVNSTGGTLTLDAAGNIDLGETAHTNSNGDVKSDGSLLLTAAGSITLDDQASAQTLNTGSTITMTAGGSVSMLNTHSQGSLIGSLNASVGLISITTGAGGTFTLNGNTANPGLFGGAGGVVIAADNMILPDNIVMQSNGQTTLKPVTAGRAIDLGTETAGKLSLTDAELDLITASTLTIGSATSGTITVSAPISPANYPTLALVGNTTFASTGGFASDVTNTTVFEKMTVSGTVDIIAGATLSLASTGGYVWNGTSTFTLLANDAADAITGTFTGPTLTNFLGSTLTAGQNYSGGTGNDLTFGRPLATIVSLNRVSGNPRNSPTASWQIVFSQPVSGLGNVNFTLANSGLTGPAITGVGTAIEASEPDTTWNITASTGTGSGTLGVNYINDTGMSHAVNTTLPFVGQTYTIDRTAPTATNFNRQNPNTTPTNADTLVWRVIFTEDVNNVTGDDFALTGTTATVTDVAVVTPSSTYDVTVSGGDLASANGLIDLNFSGTQNITDLAGNALGSTVVGFDQHYVLDNAAPTVAMSSATGNPTTNAAIPVTVQFSETVFNFVASDIVPANASVQNFTAVDGDTYTFNLVPTGAGVIATANIAANVANDEAGNGNTAATQLSRTIVDQVSIAATTPAAVEGGATGLYTFSRGGSTGDLTVNFQRDVSSTASIGTDFTLSGTTSFDTGTGAGTVVIPNGQLTATVTLTALVETPNPAEAAETTRLNLVAGSGYVLATAPNDNATVTITENSFLVTTTADSGTGSLRQAVLNANSLAGIDTITFSDGTGGTVNFTDATADTITLSSGQIVLDSNLSITGPGADLVVVRNTQALSATSRVFSLTSATARTVRISGLTITGGHLSSGSGGGIYMAGGTSTLTLVRCAVRGNTSFSYGGGIAAEGSTSLNVVSSTISGNTFTGSGGGAGIDAGGNGLRVINSTISGNFISASNSSNAGGIFSAVNGASIINSTITNNAGPGGTGGVRKFAPLTVANSIIAGNVNNATVPDIISDTAFTSNGGNLIGNAGAATGFTHGVNGDQVGTGAAPVNPQLASLASNGGSTETHALLPGSPAFNNGLPVNVPVDIYDADSDGNVAEALEFDQRGTGFSRSFGTTDIGAYEVQKSVSIADLAAISEGNSGTTNFVFTITRTGATTGDVSMTYTVSGAAVSGTDYIGGTLPTGTATITNGNATTTVSIPVAGDTTVEPDEAFTVTLSAPNNGYVVSGAPATSTITNDDSATLTLSGGGVGGEGGTRTFTATLSSAVQGGFTVAYTTNDGDATTADSDYVDNDGTLTFAGTAGESQTITVSINGDDKVELDESFTVALGAITGPAPGLVTVIDSPKTGTIFNDDFAQVLVTSLSQLEGAGNLTLEVTLSKPVDAPVSVNFTTQNGGTAQSPGDFTATSGTVSFPAGSTTAQSIPITILNDSENEADEYLILEISSLSAGGRNVSIGSTQGYGTIQNDDALTVSITAPDADADENTAATGTYRVTRNGTVGSTTVQLAIDSSSTAAAADWTQSGASFSSLAPGSTGTVVIPDGADFVDITLTPSADLHAEAAETVRLNVTADAGYTAISPSDATVTIGQNDFVVINTNNSGEGTLRQAILNANAIAGADTITFDAAVTGTITLSSGQLSVNSDVILTGPGAGLLTISGGDVSRIIYVSSGSAQASISGLSLTHGRTGGLGGAIEANGGSLVLTDCVFTDNVADEGGALAANGLSTLITRCSFSANSADEDGGAVSADGGTVLIRDSTLSGNSAFDEGGAIDNNADELSLVNCTVSNNTAATTGGGINNQSPLVVVNCTVTGNRADADGVPTYPPSADEGVGGGGIRTDDDRGVAQLFNTIVAGNVRGAVGADVPADLAPAVPMQTGVQTAVSNLIGDPASAAEIVDGTDGNIVGKPAGMGPNVVWPVTEILNPALANNGGSTLTHLLINGSPAINSGSNAYALDPVDLIIGNGDDVALTYDQRGTPNDRVRGTVVDMGAVEAFAFEPTITTATTDEDTQTANGLVVTANTADGGLTTHYKVSAILNGTLFLNDGTTAVSDGDFITVAEGTAGLKFTPDADLSDANTVAGFGFSLQAAISDADVGLRGSAVATSIAVNTVADTPNVTAATTLPDTQTTSGLVITINAVDGKEVSHFRISNILNGTLYQNDGTTAIAANSYITVLEGGAGLKFTPDTGFVGGATFDIQAATDNLGSGLSGITTATITVDHPAPDIIVLGPPVLNLRTGLFEQMVTVTNSSTVTMDGFRLTVVNMVPDVILWNRTHAFLPVIEDFNDLAPGASRQVLVQFYTKTRKLNGWVPQYVIENLSAGPDPLSGSVAGLYHGIIDRSTDAALSPNPEVGARFEMTVTAVGTVSGTITEGATRRPFTGRLSIDPSALTQPYLLVRIPRTSVDLEMFFDSTSEIAVGGIYGSGPGAQVFAWRKVWRTKAPLNLATDYRGRHNVLMENTDLDGPQGYGNMIVNVTGNDGTFSLATYLPDGTIFTGSSFVGPQGQVRVYQPLHANKGSVLGFLQIIPGLVAPAENEVLGFVDWMKPPQALTSKDRVYKDGFGPVLMICEGGYYTSPPAGQVIFGVPAASPGTFNSGFDFYEGGLDTEGLEFIQETRLYSLSATSRVNLAQVIAPNPNKVVISSFSSATGIFTGTFTLPAQTGVVGARTVGYRGLLVPACGCTLGYGYFLLPKIPVPPQTLSTSPKLSGRLEWLDADEFKP